MSIMTETLKRPNLDNDSQPLFFKPGLNVYGIAPEDALRMRLDYVNKMGWLNSDRTSDLDLYDDLGMDTQHIVHRDDSGKLVAGMRLTPIDSLEQSLSYVEMIGDDHSYRYNVSQQFSAHRTAEHEKVQLWDLTRLVHDTTREGSNSVLPAFLEMFGAGLAVTESTDASNRPWWIFLTTGKIKNTLERCGIEVHLLGQQSDGENPSYCCLVKPEEAMSKLGENPNKEAIYRVVQSGFDKTLGIN